MKYYEVIVEIKNEQEDSKGNVRIKRQKEVYLVDAMSVTEAEARVVKLFSGFTQEYQVIGVKGSKVIEVIEADQLKKKNKVEENETESVG